MYVCYLFMFANCLKNNYVNSLYDVYVDVILHVPYGNHRKMLGLTCLNNFLCMYMYVFEFITQYLNIPTYFGNASLCSM